MSNYDAVTPEVQRRCARIVAVLTHRPYRTFTRLQLGHHASTRRYPIGPAHITQWMPELQRQCIDKALYVVRPLPETHYRMWVSQNDNMVVYTEAVRDRQIYRRALRDIRKGANLDTLADYASDADVRVWASLVRNGHEQTVQAFEQRLKLAENVASASLGAMLTELIMLPEASW